MSGARSTLETPVLVGVEVTLRPMTLDDAGGLAAAAAESREHYRLSVVPEGEGAMRAYAERFLRQQAAGDRLPFVTEWRGRVVGSTSFIEPRIWAWPPGSAMQRADRPDVVEIGSTWLAASAQRTRCNSEAKLLMLAHAFERWTVHAVFLKTDARNERSRRAIERLGAAFDGIRRADMPGADGTVRNSAWYSITAPEWPSIKAQLQRRLAGAGPASDP
jgi:RimJ/RimL family protein N-acetyltransferase